MPTQTTISPLQLFREIFPDHRLASAYGELKYRYGIHEEVIGRIYERMAQRIILKKGLPLTADLEKWSVCGSVRRIVLVVKAVPENSFEDESQDDEGLTGGWWNKSEE